MFNHGATPAWRDLHNWQLIRYKEREKDSKVTALLFLDDQGESVTLGKLSGIGHLKEEKINSFWACWVQGAVFPKQYSKSFFFFLELQTSYLTTFHFQQMMLLTSQRRQTPTYLVFMSAFFSLKCLYLHILCFLLMVRIFYDSPVTVLGLSSSLCLVSSVSSSVAFYFHLLLTHTSNIWKTNLTIFSFPFFSSPLGAFSKLKSIFHCL